MRVLIDFGSVFKNFDRVEAELVDTLPPFIEPDPAKVERYYEGPSGEPPPKWCFKAVTHPRNVYKKKGGGYIVLARTEDTKKYVKPL